MVSRGNPGRLRADNDWIIRSRAIACGAVCAAWEPVHRLVQRFRRSGGLSSAGPRRLRGRA
ncbi:MAG: hypothetical protein AVDCRST_MAG71-56 [uncultured Lysobacter sp.]|uniref:Uncharacterized protein n=1 Tax=uncultured Lysobacter sp. TaxID=271060 RepID=A0A6J4KAI7_9GAMM|nr:MAG: hypothetical protein AVDCRST_MAG71-56 [uncultured Lysobacter sp.]